MKRLKSKILIASLSIASVGATLAGCSSNSASTDTSAVSGTTKKGGVLTVGSGQSCGTMDPVQAYDGWYPMRYGVCQTLIKLDEQMNVEAWLVEDDFKSNDNYTEWTFTVKDGVTFSNGNKLTGEAVKASLDNVFNKGERGPEYFVPTSITADGQKVTIKLKEGDPILPNKLADPLFCIIDMSVDNSDIANKGPIGTGPFVVKSFDSTTKECNVVRNDNYWDGEVALDGIDFIYTEDQAAITMGFKNGDYDAVYNLSMNDIGQFETDSSYKIVSNPSGRTTNGFMNQSKGKALSDKTLRQAILQNIDKETYVTNLLKNQYVVGKTLLTSAADYGYDELKDPNSYNRENAIKLLDDAGYKDTDGDGFREDPNGKKIDLQYVYYTGRPEQQIVVEATQADMAEIGIKVTPVVQDTQTVMDNQAAGNYDLLCMSINMMNSGDPENQIRTYFAIGGSYNATGYTSEKFNTALNNARKEADADKRKAYIMEAEQCLLDDAVSISYCYPKMNFVTKSNVNNVYSTLTDYYWVDENTSFSE